MLDHTTTSPSTLRRGLHALACLTVLVFGGSQAGALPPVQLDPTPGLLLIQGGPPSAEQQAHEDRQAPIADLDEVLRATRVKLEELTERTARVAADTKRYKEMRAVEKDNERLAAELQEARARQTDLEGSRALAEARLAELTKNIDEARRESTRLDEAFATLRGQNKQLEERLTHADAARLAALGKVRQAQAEMAKKLKTAADEVKQAKAELISRREELAINHKKLAEANGAREQIEARVIVMEKRVERSGAEAERLRTELADAKEQLKQVAAAAVAAERVRQAASHEADRLRNGAEAGRKELSAAKTEIARLQIANAELERQMHSLHRDLRSATDTARQNLIVMEEKIEELSAAHDSARSEEAEPTRGLQAKPDAIEQERDAAMPEAPSAMAQPPTPEPVLAAKASSPSPTAASIEGAAVKAANTELQQLIDSLVADSMPATGAARPDAITTEDAIGEVSAALAVSRPEEGAPTSDAKVKQAAVQEKRDAAVASGLARFNADLQALNELEMNAAGSHLFTGVESADGREVHVAATAAWDSLPAVGRESYLESLLGSWVAAQGGKGPAVVRIVDSRGQVLVEKSWP
jgi:myosin heavy subunit